MPYKSYGGVVEIAVVIVIAEEVVLVGAETVVGSSKMIKVQPIMPILRGKTVRFSSVPNSVRYKVLN